MPDPMRILSVNVGQPRLVMHRGKRYTTSINKSPANDPVELTPTGCVGDKQADTRVHGGPDKAINCYPHEHYAYFMTKLGRDLPVPSFGENLTTIGLLEDVVAIGDTFRIGDAVVQVTQPREPCVKLARKLDAPQVGKWIHDAGYTGFYLRVLEPHPVEAGDTIELIERPHPTHTIARAMDTQFGEHNPDALRDYLSNEALSDAWRTRMKKRLDHEASSD